MTVDFLDGSGDPRGGPGGVGGPSGTRGEVLNGSGEPLAVRDGSVDPLKFLEQVGGPSGRSETGQRTLGVVRDESGDLRLGPGRVEIP